MKSIPFPPGSSLIFQAYGSRENLQECLFALLTFCQFHSTNEWNDLQIWIYTDQPEFFKQYAPPLPLYYREMTREVLKNWAGPHHFVHRIKIEILQDFLSRHPDRDVLYLDSDTCFAGSIAPILRGISEGRLYMHTLEGRIYHSRNRVFKKLSVFLKQNIITAAGEEINIPEDTTMWNAGLLGISSDRRPILKQVLAFTDAIYPRYPKHIIEQFAFSYYFQKNDLPAPGYPTVDHYWNLKELRVIFTSFFQFFENATWGELVRLSVLIRLPDIMQQKMGFYENRSILGKLLKKRWQPDVPDWHVLADKVS